jgi:protein-disulfide isomerase
MASSNRKTRQRLAVGGALVAVLGLAVGVGVYASSKTSAGAAGASGGDEAAGKPYVRPAHTTGEDGIVVPYGKADAKNVLTVWLDPRCPYCAGIEQGLGRTFKEEADAGTFRVEYRFATFLDGSLGGKGSKRALNALGAAVNESPEKFMEYLQVLFVNHPARESDDVFGSDAKLLELAGKIPGLRTPAFDRAVEELTYLPWAERTGRAFQDEGKRGTPDVSLNGTQLVLNTGRGIESVTPEAFRQLIAPQLDKD